MSKTRPKAQWWSWKLTFAPSRKWRGGQRALQKRLTAREIREQT